MSGGMSRASCAIWLKVSITLTRTRFRKEVAARAEAAAEERLLDALVGESATAETRTHFKTRLRGGELDDKEVEIELQDSGNSNLPTMEIPGMPGAQVGAFNLGDLIPGMKKPTVKRSLRISRARTLLLEEEADKLIDQMRWCKRRSIAHKTTALSFWMRSTRSPFLSRVAAGR